MASISRIIRRHYERKAASDSAPLPTPSTRRVQSSIEREAIYVSAEHRSVYCFHNIPLFSPCIKCNRSKESGVMALQRLMRHFGITEQ
jgi:hypothetical protein